jgi:hypothetical protein
MGGFAHADGCLPWMIAYQHRSSSILRGELDNGSRHLPDTVALICHLQGVGLSHRTEGSRLESNQAMFLVRQLPYSSQRRDEPLHQFSKSKAIVDFGDNLHKDLEDYPI